MSNTLFTPRRVIPAGYAVIVNTWENDGDDYGEYHILGIPDKAMVNQLLHVLQWFAHSSDDMGNEDIQHEEILDRLWNGIQHGFITSEFFKRYLDIEFPVGSTDDDHDDWLDRIASTGGFAKVQSMVHKFLGFPVSYDIDFARMVENVEVRYFEQEYVVPALENPLASFDGSWQERHKVDPWKL